MKISCWIFLHDGEYGKKKRGSQILISVPYAKFIQKISLHALGDCLAISLGFEY